MQITIELPEDIAAGLQSKWKDLPRAALESTANRLAEMNYQEYASGWADLATLVVPQDEIGAPVDH